MIALRTAAALARNDFKLIRRDSFLVSALIYILALAALARIYLPVLRRYLADRGVDLEPFYPLIASYMAVMLGAMMVGIFFGFLLIDERDEHTLAALLVTPLPLRTYLGYRVGLPVILAVPLILVLFAILDLALLPAWQLLLVALAGAPLAAITTLFLPSFADNKVQAFALAKILSGSAMLPVAAYFLDEPWQFLAGVYPPYWVLKAFWTASAGGSGWWLFLIVGAAGSTALTAWFMGRFERLAHG